MISQSVLSTKYIEIPVTATINGVPYNPTGDQVQFAFVLVGTQPGSGDWHTGSWETVSGEYLARILVGPATGGVALPVGTYTIWVKITDNPEVPVDPVGLLDII